ncbi:MAG: hypothetical protein AAB291_01175 [Chloroflexota bacterium]
MSRRKDRERYQSLKQQNPDYGGFRGVTSTPIKAPPAMESVVCSGCGRKRNVPVDTLPADRSRYLCLRCQEEQAKAGIDAAG